MSVIKTEDMIQLEQAIDILKEDEEKYSNDNFNEIVDLKMQLKELQQDMDKFNKSIDWFDLNIKKIRNINNLNNYEQQELNNKIIEKLILLIIFNLDINLMNFWKKVLI